MRFTAPSKAFAVSAAAGTDAVAPGALPTRFTLAGLAAVMPSLPHLLLVTVIAGVPSEGHAAAPSEPGCTELAVRECVTQALEAMGGRQRLESVRNVRLDVLSHTAVVEQSYRQAPFLTAYQRSEVEIDLAGQRLRRDVHSSWPEADLAEADSARTLVATARGGVYRTTHGDIPCSRSSIDATRAAIELGPLRLLSTALSSSDLHYEPPETLRSTSHTMIAFRWNRVTVRVALNPFNHLPDAVDSTEQFHDFWYFWGDVRQRVWWDNWRYVSGIRYPSSEITERNGAIWTSAQAVDLVFNVTPDERDFQMDPTALARSEEQKAWDLPFSTVKATTLAPGIDLYSGAWNTTIVHQRDGVVILETPSSEAFTRGVFAEAANKYPGEHIRAILTTSDSWPHVGGVRFGVSQRIPLYALDLNLALLTQLVSAPHTLEPDNLQMTRTQADWRVVSGKSVVGSGPNRMELYPLRGASTERQYIVYFPEHQLLYASDSLVIRDTHTLYNPELMHEVRQAVEREGLEVRTVYAMHQGPTPWKEIIGLLDATG